MQALKLKPCVYVSEETSCVCTAETRIPFLSILAGGALTVHSEPLGAFSAVWVACVEEQCQLRVMVLHLPFMSFPEMCIFPGEESRAFIIHLLSRGFQSPEIEFLK